MDSGMGFRRPLLIASAAGTAVLALTVVAEAGPNRYGHSDRVERHMLPAVSTGPLDPEWSPDGDWIAFSMRGDIWKVPAGGGEAIALTEGPAYHFEPTWSPDGSRLALSMDVDGNLDIGVVDAAGGPVTRITTHPEVDVQPEWTPDGGGVYFVSARGGGFQVFLRSLADTLAHPVVRGIQPAVSPDGSQLAFVGRVEGRLGTGGLWTVPLAGGEPRLVHYEESEYRMAPAWTVDGRALLYVSDEMGSNDVAIVPVAGGNPIVLTVDTLHEFSPSVSPDGTRMAFVSNRRGPTSLFTAPLSGGPNPSWTEVPMTGRSARRATGRIRARVVDEAGRARSARVYLLASDGRGYAPEGMYHRVIAATETHYFHADGAFEVEVPVGQARVEAMRGHEYRPVAAVVDVAGGATTEIELRLERMIDLPARGWYSGDTHVHDLHQGRFGLTHADFFLQLEAEDLHVSNALIHMDGTRLMGRWGDLTGKPHPLSTPEHILQYGEEFRGSLGHVAMLGIREYILPFTGGVRGTAYAQPELDLPYLDGARGQGGIAGFLHPFNAPVERPSQAAGSLIALDVALGRGEFYDIGALVSDELGSAEFYYRLLNAGFRLAATGGTDNFSDVWRDPPPGADRTYVRLDGTLDVQAWLDGIRAQRTFMSTGPLLFLDVEGREPGEEIGLAPGSEGQLSVRAEVTSITPVDVLEIIVNGRVAATSEPEDAARTVETGLTIETDVNLPDGGWIAARARGPSSRYVTDSYAFAHTSPVYVTRGGVPWTSAEDAEFLVESIRLLWERVRDAPWRTDAERERFRAAVDQAIAVYERIAREGR